MTLIEHIQWTGMEAWLSRDEICSTVEYKAPSRTLSSAVLNGGLRKSKRILNLKVQANRSGQELDKNRVWDPPEKTLSDFAQKNDLTGPVSGMMTSALMESFRFSKREERWGGVFSILTAGLSNARAAGDVGNFEPEVKGEMLPTGTINIIIGTNVNLSDAALTEAVMLASEAKTSVLTKYNIKSTLSGLPATGTGTDSIAVTCGTGPEVQFCGKHTRIGQLIGESVQEALSSSVEYLLKRDLQ